MAEKPIEDMDPKKVQERAARARATMGPGRFLEARRGVQALGRGTAAPVSAPPAADPLRAEMLAAHTGLSRASAAFLELAERDPELLERRSFAPLEGVSTFRPYPLQAWPAFVDSARVAEMERVSTGLARLIKSLPRRLFDGDPERLDRFYGLGGSQVARSMLAEPNGIEAALGRGDFLDTPAGLQCLEFNMVSDLGGWQAPVWAEAYLRVPPLRRFLESSGFEVSCRNTLGILFSHVLGEARRLPGLDDEVNLAFVTLEDLPAAVRRDMEVYLNGQYAAALRREEPARRGAVEVLPYPALAERGGCLWAGVRRIHAVVEAHHGGTAAPAFRSFKAGNLHLYNAAARVMLTDKRNLALLSEHGEADRFDAAERELIRRHVPWTRCLVPAEAELRGERVWLPELAVTRRTGMVIKRARLGQGTGVHVGAFTAEAEWRERVARALEQGDWVIQERVESRPFLHQHGERGCAPHEVVWGLFVFGSRYAGGFLSLRPQGESGVVNVLQGASEGVIFEVGD